MYLFVKGCTCKDLVNVHGFGNCRDRKNIHQGNKAICYVNLPSDCNDLVDSIMIPGEKSSAEACHTHGKYFTKMIYHKNIVYFYIFYLFLVHNTYIHILLSAVDEDGNNQMGKSKKVELEKMITDVPGIVKIYAKVFSGSKWEEIAFVILVVLSIIM